MYHHSDNFLDTPPPQSQFRRPWSPDPYDPLPSTSHLNYDLNGDQVRPHFPQRQRPRDASDVSVEALDLADYARTLRLNPSPYPEFRPQQEQYPPSPRALHPLPLSPHSLVSDGQTASSPRSYNTHTSRSQRAISLPPPAPAFRPTSPLSRSEGHLSIQPHSEIDVSQFPRWSRNWYGNKPNHSSGTSPDGYLSASSEVHDPKRPSHFDPGYPNDLHPNPYPHLSYPYFLPSTDSHRDTVPWGSDPPDYGPPLNSEVKEERMRMLKQEFGRQSTGKGRASAYVDEEGKPIVGSVDEKGRLVTQGPKKRVAVRLLQVALALGACIPSIYVALSIKPMGKPPPMGTPAAYALYITSIITVLSLTYLFLVRPCCTGRRSKGGSDGTMAGLPGGMMVLPVSVPGTGKKGNKPKKGKKAKGGVSGGDVQVNLIMDPGMFARDSDHDSRGEGHSDPDDDDYDNYTIPGSYSHRSSSRPRRKAKPRRSIFAGLAHENAWREARHLLKRMTLVDVGGMVLWGAVFVFILVGKNCPVGQFEGWCTGYNVATASACLLCVAFGVSIFFDVKDLHASRVSPRTRG